MQPLLEARLAELTFFAALREDERLRVAERFRLAALRPDEKYEFAPSSPRMVIVLDGAVALVDGKGTPLSLATGDVVGEIDILLGRTTMDHLRALEPSAIALLDRAALDALFQQFPAIAPPWLAELAREVRWRNGLLREVLATRDADLPPEALEAVLARRRRSRHRHQRSAVKNAAAHLVRTLVTVPRSRPSFWVLVGAVLALASARTVVAMIIQNGLQKHLFALIADEMGHPIHVHHFNYGLLLVILAGLLALVPRARGWIKRISFVFGFGVGLIVDEFALLWNLNPDYYQPLSRFVAGGVILALVQVVYFRNLYLALAKRVLRLVRL